MSEEIQASELKEIVESSEAQTVEELDKRRVVEAALFLANKPMSAPEVALIAKTSVKQARELLVQLQKEYEEKHSALEIAFNANGEAAMQVRSKYLSTVAPLSREVELSRKGLKIMALIAKKQGILQSELKHYFRGEIYEYIHELKEMGYLNSEKRGNTRLLKPTKKFSETYQMSEV